MKKHTRFSPPAVGASALLVSLALLMLCIFSLLSLTSAQAEHRLAQASVRAGSAYYAADLQAEELFARLRAGELPSQVTREGNTYSYECYISDYQVLAVTLCCENGSWEILSWQAVAQTAPESSTTPTLWDGGGSL